jgi:CheY-like chemotaxis protein
MRTASNHDRLPSRRKGSKRGATAKTHRVLILSDDAKLREELLSILSADGEFTIDEAVTPTDAEQMLISVSDTHYDGIILDSDFPDVQGINLCIGLRKMGYAMPIISLTGSANDSEIVRALDAGASDVVIKPISLPILLAGLRAQLRNIKTDKAGRVPTRKAILRQLDLVDDALRKIEPITRGIGHNGPPDAPPFQMPLRSAECHRALSAVASIRHEFTSHTANRVMISKRTSSLGEVATDLRRWLAQRGNIASLQFAKSFGKAAGTTAGIVTIGAMTRLVTNAHGTIDTLIGMLSRWLGAN